MSLAAADPILVGKEAAKRSGFSKYVESMEPAARETVYRSLGALLTGEGTGLTSARDVVEHLISKHYHDGDFVDLLGKTLIQV